MHRFAITGTIPLPGTTQTPSGAACRYPVTLDVTLEMRFAKVCAIAQINPFTALQIYYSKLLVYGVTCQKIRAYIAPYGAMLEAIWF